MTPRRRQRLILVGLLLLGVGGAVALALTALNQNINLFYSPTQVVAGEAPDAATFRLGGMVVDGSVERGSADLKVRFDLTDTGKHRNGFLRGHPARPVSRGPGNRHHRQHGRR